MKTDRELLELAAKAAGVHLEWNGDSPVEVFGRWNGNPSEPPEQDHRDWNPLTDDGDAFRLAVKLAIEISPCPECDSVLCEPKGCADSIITTEALDDYGTRRAIVLAAAAIGESMQ